MNTDQVSEREILSKIPWVSNIRKEKFLIKKLEKNFLLLISEALEPSIACSGYTPHYVWPPGYSIYPKTIYSSVQKSQPVTKWQCFEKD